VRDQSESDTESERESECDLNNTSASGDSGLSDGEHSPQSQEQEKPADGGEAQPESEEEEEEEEEEEARSEVEAESEVDESEEEEEEEAEHPDESEYSESESEHSDSDLVRLLFRTRTAHTFQLRASVPSPTPSRIPLPNLDLDRLATQERRHRSRKNNVLAAVLNMSETPADKKLGEELAAQVKQKYWQILRGLEEGHVAEALHDANDCIDRVLAGTMGHVAASVVVSTELVPDLVEWLLSRSHYTEEQALHVNCFLQRALVLVHYYLKHSFPRLLTTWSHIFNPTTAFYTHCGVMTPMDCQETGLSDDEEVEIEELVDARVPEDPSQDGEDEMPAAVAPLSTISSHPTSASSTVPSSTVVAAMKSEPVSKYLIANINYFAEIQGFNVVVEHLFSENAQANRIYSDVIHDRILPIAYIANYLTPEFANKLGSALEDGITKLYTSYTYEDLKLEPSIRQEGVLICLDGILMATPSRAENCNRRLDQLRLHMALKLIRSPILAQRLNGLNNIKRMVACCKANAEYLVSRELLKAQRRRERNKLKRRNQQADDRAPTVDLAGDAALGKLTLPHPRFSLSEDELSDWLLEVDLMELLYGRESAHVELLRRCIEIPNFLSQLDKLSAKHIDLIWAAAHNVHESIAKVLFTSLVSLVQHLKIETTDHFYAKLCKLPISEYDHKTMDLVRNLSIQANQSTEKMQPRRFYGLELMYQVVIDESGVVQPGSAVFMEGLRFLREFLRWPVCHPQRDHYLERCMQNVRDHVAVPQSLRLLLDVIDSYPSAATLTDPVSQHDVVMRCEQQGKLLEHVFEDLLHYKHAAQEAVAADGEAVADFDHRCFRGVYPHQQQVMSRLDFLNAVLRICPDLRLNAKQVALLWRALVADCLTPNERDLGYKWFSRATEAGANACDEEALAGVFIDLMPTLDVVSLSATGFEMFRRYFRLINLQQGHMYELSTVGPAPAGATAAQRAPEFKVLTTELRGVELLWRVALGAETPAVGEQAATLLLAVHLNLDEATLGPAVEEHRRAFVARCMQELTAAVELRSSGPKAAGKPSSSAELAAAGLRVQRSLTLLARFLDELEPSAAAHSAGAVAQPIEVHLSLFGGGASGSTRKTVSVDAADTADRLLIVCAQALGLPRTHFRMVFAGREIKDKLLKETLAQLNIVNGVTVQLLRRPADSLPSATSAAAAAELPAAAANEQPGSQSQSLPSALLNSPERFSTLFGLMATGTREDAAAIWRLVERLPTNPEELARLRDLSEDGAADWSALLSPSCLYRLLYGLDIVQRLAHPGRLHGAQAGREAACAEWRRAFVNSGGVVHLTTLLCSAADSPNVATNPPHMYFRCVQLLLDVLCMFVLTDADAPVLESLPAAMDQSAEHQASPATAATAPGTPCGVKQRAALAAHALRPEHVLLLTGSSLLDKLVLILWHVASERSAQRAVSAAEQAESLEASRTTTNGPLRPVAPTKAERRRRAFAELVRIAQHASELLSALLVTDAQVLQRFLASEALGKWLAGTLLQCPVTLVREHIATALLRVAVHPSVEPRSCALLQQRLLQFLQHTASSAEQHGEQERCPLFSPLHSTPAQYYELLCALVAARLQATSSAAETAPLPDDLAALLRQVIELLSAHRSTERRFSPKSAGSDETLVGLLSLLSVLLSSVPLDERMRMATEDALLDELLERCLFELPTRDNHGALAPPKCKTQRARALAFEALAALLSNGEQHSAWQSVVHCLTEQNRREQPRSFWSYRPVDHRRARNGFVGLKNQGATCYMNSLLQQFFCIPEFRHEFFAASVPTKPPTQEGSAGAAGTEQKQEPEQKQGQKQEQTATEAEAEQAEEQAAEEVPTLVSELQRIFAFLQESEEQFYDTKPFLKVCTGYDGKPTNPYVQMDADEFFNMITDKLERALAGSEHATLLKRFFGGKLSHQIISQECEHTTEREEDFMTLSVDVQNKNCLDESLQLFVQGDMLDGDNKYFCDRCQKKVSAIKRCCVGQLPNILFVHMKRFEFDFETMERGKVNTEWQFPIDFSLFPFTREGLAQQSEHEQASSDVGEGEGEGEGEGGSDSGEAAAASASSSALSRKIASHRGAGGGAYDYRLAGVIVHNGTAESGHYYSFVQDRSVPDGSQWYKFNDAQVTRFHLTDLPRECYGGQEMHSVWDAQAGRHFNRMFPKTYSGYMLLYERVQRQENIPPRLPLLPEEAASRVPHLLYSEVWDRNMSFLQDSNVFDPAYFQFASGLVLGVKASSAPAHAYGPPPAGEAVPAVMRAFQLGTHLALDSIAHAKHQTQLHPLCEHLCALASAYPPACHWFLQRLLRCGWATSLLFKCREVPTRREFADLLVHVLRVARTFEVRLYRDVGALQHTQQHDAEQGDTEAMSIDDGDEEQEHEQEEQEECSQEAGRRRLGKGKCNGQRAATRKGKGKEEASSSGKQVSRVSRKKSRAAAWAAPLIPLDAPDTGSLVCATLEHLLGMLREAHNHWLHFDCYFEVFVHVAHFGVEERNWMRTQNVVARFVDQFCGEHSPFWEARGSRFRDGRRAGGMGDPKHRTAPRSESMVRLVQLLMRECPSRGALASGQPSPYRLTSIASSITDAAATSGVALVPPSAYDEQLARHPVFYSMLADRGVGVADLAPLAQHLAWMDSDFSAQLLNTLSGALMRAEPESHVSFYALFNALMAVPDALHGDRVLLCLESMLHLIEDGCQHGVLTAQAIDFVRSVAQQSHTACHWLLENAPRWLCTWVLLHTSRAVRIAAEHLINYLVPLPGAVDVTTTTTPSDTTMTTMTTTTITITTVTNAIPSTAAETSATAGTAEPAAASEGASQGSESAWQPSDLQRRQLLTQLLDLLERAQEYVRGAPETILVPDEGPSNSFYHLDAYLRLISRCLRPGDDEDYMVMLQYFSLLADLLCAIDREHVNCDLNRVEVVKLFYRLLLERDELFGECALELTTLHNQLNVFHVLHAPLLPKVHEYNRQLLPPFYGSLLCMVRLGKRGSGPAHPFVMNLAQQHSIMWAMNTIYPAVTYDDSTVHTLQELLLEFADFQAFRAAKIQPFISSSSPRLGDLPQRRLVLLSALLISRSDHINFCHASGPEVLSKFLLATLLNVDNSETSMTALRLLQRSCAWLTESTPDAERLQRQRVTALQAWTSRGNLIHSLLDALTLFGAHASILAVVSQVLVLLSSIDANARAQVTDHMHRLETASPGILESLQTTCPQLIQMLLAPDV